MANRKLQKAIYEHCEYLIPTINSLERAGLKMTSAVMKGRVKSMLIATAYSFKGNKACDFTHSSVSDMMKLVKECLEASND